MPSANAQSLGVATLRGFNRFETHRRRRANQCRFRRVRGEVASNKLHFMLKGRLIHPQILAALARGGHNSRVLISDSNYPHWTKRGPNAEVVFLNLSPGLVGATDVLQALLSVIPVEKAAVMDTYKTGPNAMTTDPPVWAEFRAALDNAGCREPFEKLMPIDFYAAASTPDVVLTIATGEERIYSNLLLTIGVVK